MAPRWGWCFNAQSNRNSYNLPDSTKKWHLDVSLRCNRAPAGRHFGSPDNVGGMGLKIRRATLDYNRGTIYMARLHTPGSNHATIEKHRCVPDNEKIDFDFPVGTSPI